MDIEKKNVIYKLNNNVGMMKFMLIFMACTSLICSICCSLSLSVLKEDNFSEIFTMFMGTYFILIGLNGSGFLESLNNRGNSCFYETYAIVPVKREYIISQEFRFWKYVPIVSSIILTMINLTYFINPVTREISGYFVLITVSNIILLFFDYFGRFHKNKFAFMMKTIGFFICALGVFISLRNVFVRECIKFLKLEIFKGIAGIPMIVISLMIVPIFFVLHYKYTLRNSRKISAWY